MEAEAGEYSRLDIKQYAPRSIRETAENKFWKKFKAPVVAKQFGPVSHIDFSQQYPHHFAITASTRVILYDGRSRQVRRTFGRFKDTTYCGNLRSDGKLMVAGGQDGIVQVFDANSRGLLRQFKGHKRAAHVAQFSPDKLHVLSGGDDVTVRLWDLSSGAQVCRLDGHADYVRAAAVAPNNDDTWATGGYDHICKLWDVRAPSAAVLSLDHGAPIEDVTFFPSGSLVVTAGGSHLCVWDVLSGGKLLQKLTNFQKTVTCVRLSPLAGPDSAAAPRMLAGSLDGHVKIFELDSFKVTHASKYPAPVLSLGISPDCQLLAVGMADGTLSVRRHERPSAAAADQAKAQARRHYQPRLTAANYRYFIRGQNEKASADDYKVAARKRAHLNAYDKYLRKFRYKDALDAALQTKRPDVVCSVLEELAGRGGLQRALGNRDAEALLPLLGFLAKYIAEPRHSRLLTDVSHRILDTYAPAVGVAGAVDAKLQQLRERLQEELKLQEALAAIQGCLEPILAASLSGLSLQD